MNSKKCTCGESAIGGGKHSSYCDLLKPDEPENPGMDLDDLWEDIQPYEFFEDYDVTMGEFK